MGLKQRVIFESQQPGVDFSYDKKLVQGTFLHTIYQGLNEKNSYVRHDLKPFLSDMQVSDDFLLEQVTKSTSEEEGRLKRLITVAKTRPVTVNSVRHDSGELTDQNRQTKVDSELHLHYICIYAFSRHLSKATYSAFKLQLNYRLIVMLSRN